MPLSAYCLLLTAYRLRLTANLVFRIHPVVADSGFGNQGHIQLNRRFHFALQRRRDPLGRIC